MAVEPVAVFFADSHLDPFIWKHRRDICGDSFMAFEWLLKYAASLGVPAFIAGDVLEMKKPPSSVVEFLTRMNAMCRRNSTSVYFIQGQHDHSNPPWLSAVGRSGFYHLNRDQVEVGGQRVFGIDWHTRSGLMQVFEEQAKEIEQCDVLMMHQVWHDLMGGINSGEVRSSDIPPGPKLVLTGDYHRFEKLSPNNSANTEFQLISPGATHIRSSAEPIKKYCCVLMSDGSWKKKAIAATRPAVMYVVRSDDSRKYVLDTIEKTANELQTTAKSLNKAIRKPMVIVRYQPDFYEAVSEIEKKVIELGMHCVLRVSQSGMRSRLLELDDGNPEISPESVRTDTATSIAERIRKNVDDDPLAREILLRIVNYMESPVEARDELVLLRDEFITSQQAAETKASEDTWDEFD